MELELQGDPDAIAGLGAFRPLAALRQGRPRSEKIRTIWYDNADHALRSAGQILAESRGGWQLQRLLPGSGTWLPGQPPPILAEALSLAALTASTSVDDVLPPERPGAPGHAPPNPM